MLPKLASLVSFTPQDEAHVLADPCAGDGAAIAGLRKHWFPEHERDAAIFAVELEEQRARDHHQWLSLHYGTRRDVSIHGDAFHVDITAQEGASLLYLNPPYDFDKVHGRLEQRFLERWTAALLPGDGVLMLVVPFYALQASARFLSRHYQDLRAWRFPEGLFEAYRQCVLVARRRSAPVRDNPLDERRVERWAADAGAIPELRDPAEAPFRVRAGRAGLKLDLLPLDLPGLVSAFKPWHRAGFAGLNRTVREMIGAKFPVAQPPRPAHIALALSVGTLNGKRLTPNRPGLPPILVKGSFRRDFHPVEERFNQDGDSVGTVQIQRPRLALSVLRLDTLEFLELFPGAAPSGATSLPDFNSADLVEHYGESLGRLMREQFPALHDPANPAHEMALPPLARQPFKVQRSAILTALKLLAQGENPQAIAEVGTGKSTVALSIAGALSPAHFQATAGELRRLGFSTQRLSPVARTLIICPPHLLKSWRDQAAAVLPGHRVVIVETIADLRRDAEIFVLSREVAKLGHGVAGIGQGELRPRWRSVCPRCGAQPELSPEALAETRARCEAVSRVPVNEAARIAEDLAACLIHAYPFDPRVRTLVSGHRILAMSLPPVPEEAEDGLGEDGEAEDAGEQEMASLPADRLRPVALRLLGLIATSAYPDYRLPNTLDRVCRAGGLQAEFAERLRQHASELLDRAAKALEVTSSEYHESVFAPRRQGGALLELAAKLERTEEETVYAPPLLQVLDVLNDLGNWEEGEPCREPLFQAIPAPRRYPLARYILSHCRGRFGLLIADEWHEYSKKGSAQQKAAHRLVELPGVPTLALTGSLMGGYAASLFPNMWALSGRMRRQFRPGEAPGLHHRLWLPEDLRPEHSRRRLGGHRLWRPKRPRGDSGGSGHQPDGPGPGGAAHLHPGSPSAGRAPHAQRGPRRGAAAVRRGARADPDRRR